MSNEIQFFTSILSMQSCLKDQYALSIIRTWDLSYVIHVLDVTKCQTFDEDPCIIQQHTALCCLKKEADLKYEVNRFWKRLVKENVIKDEFLVKNP